VKDEGLSLAWRSGAAPAGGAPVAALARLRQGCYRLLSQSLLFPQEERLRTLALAAQELSRRGRRSRAASYYLGWGEFLDAVEHFAAQELATLRTHYARGFFAGPAGAPCPLYESSYVSSGPAAQGWFLGQLAKEYAEAGVTPSPHSGEPGDHAAVELEFMGYLCSMEGEAWEQEDLSQAVQALRRQERFLQEHLTGYLPGVSRSVGCCSACTSYAHILEAASDFVLCDFDLVRALHQRFQECLSPSEVVASGLP